jgi:hypothetical protein
LKSYWSNNSINFLAITYLVVSFTSNSPIVICQSYLSSFKKLITNAKTSCAPFDIHKSKLVVAKSHFVEVDKTYNYLVFSTKLGNNSWENYFLEGKRNLGHKCMLHFFNQILCTNYKGSWFLIIQCSRSSKSYFCYKSSFLKGFFVTKKLNMELLQLFDLFFASCVSSSFKALFTFSIFSKK